MKIKNVWNHQLVLYLNSKVILIKRSWNLFLLLIFRNSKQPPEIDKNPMKMGYYPYFWTINSNTLSYLCFMPGSKNCMSQWIHRHSACMLNLCVAQRFWMYKPLIKVGCDFFVLTVTKWRKNSEPSRVCFKWIVLHIRPSLTITV